MTDIANNPRSSINALSVDRDTSIATNLPTICLPMLCQPNNTYATEHRSDCTTSPKYRCVNKNANGPKTLGSRSLLSESKTPAASYSPGELAPVPRRIRNKNAGGPTPKILNTSVTSPTHITQLNIDGVLNDTERCEMKTSDHKVLRGVNKNMKPVVKFSHPHVKQTPYVKGFNDKSLLKSNAGVWSFTTSVLDAPVTVTIGNAPQTVNLGAKPTKMDVAAHSINRFDLKNAFANLNIERDQVESADATVNNIQVKTPIHIRVEARPGHYYNPVEYDRPLYRR